MHIYNKYLKKVYDRNVVNKYGLYLLLGVIIYNLIDYIYIYTYVLENSGHCIYSIGLIGIHPP